MFFRRSKRAELKPDGGPIQAFNECWWALQHASKKVWEEANSSSTSIEKCDAREQETKDLAKASQQALTDFTRSEGKREEVLEVVRQTGQELRPQMERVMWPGTLLEAAESRSVSEITLSPQLPLDGRLMAGMMAVVSLDVMKGLAEVLKAEGDAIQLSHVGPDRIRVDWWLPWRENERMDDKRYSYMMFEWRLRNRLFTCSQYHGTLWFQRRMIEQVASLLDGDAPEPLTPYLRLDLANHYRDKFAQLHQLYTGTAPMPVPPILYPGGFDGVTPHLRGLQENAERAARFQLKHCQRMDSLLHFDLASLGLQEGSELGTLFSAGFSLAKKRMNGWKEVLEAKHASSAIRRMAE